MLLSLWVDKTLSTGLYLHPWCSIALCVSYLSTPMISFDLGLWTKRNGKPVLTGGHYFNYTTHCILTRCVGRKCHIKYQSHKDFASHTQYTLGLKYRHYSHDDQCTMHRFLNTYDRKLGIHTIVHRLYTKNTYHIRNCLDVKMCQVKLV